MNLDLEDGASLKEALRSLVGHCLQLSTKVFDHDDALSRRAIVIANNRNVLPGNMEEVRLKHGDTIILTSPFGGG
jgi:molybdopterin converting factor small subunit